MNEPEKPASAPSPVDAAKAAFEEYYLAVGKVARAWNTLHESLGQLFVTVSGSDKVWTEAGAIKVALAIWYSVKSDRAQRDMLRAAFNANSGRWEKLPKALDDFKWLLDRCDELAEQRNDAVHAPCSIYIGSGPNGAEMGPAYFAAGNPRAKNLEAKNLKGKQLIAEFDWCERYAWTLIGFIQKLEKPMVLPDRYRWPDRPPKPTRKTKP
jgi:hypothetical protein